MQITPTNESPEEVPVTIGSLKPIDGTYFMKTIMEQMGEIQKMADDLNEMSNFPMYFPSEATEIEFASCGKCEKKITLNLIASFGADHHDSDEIMCEDCFAGRITRAESYA